MARLTQVAANEATAELSRRDGCFARLADEAGPWKLQPPNPEGPYAALVRSITFQQLAGAAAATIHGRLRALVEGPLTPEAVLGLADEDLAGAGLSGSKRAAIRDLSQKVLDGSVKLDRLGRMSDEAIVEMLVSVRGIGVWTAQMVLMFQLRRPDVWPTGDLAVRAGYGLMQGLAAPPTAKELEPLGDVFRPWRSVAAHYCWEAVHLSRVKPVALP